jgi:lipopolysaccharide/colanic/teichoic acid biosynthesis glycosyltransferase
MGLIVAICFAVLAILAATASRMIADDFKAWAPWIVRYLIRRAVRRLHKNQRERFAEEWSSHVNEIPGEIGKLLVAFGFLRASWKMTPDLGQDLPFAFFKRAFDLCLSAFAIVLLVPLMLVAVLCIKAESRGPAVYWSTRRGYKNKTIRLFRFRTFFLNEDGGPNSGQVTWIGKFLRHTALEELPQLFNVILGDISFVGPRPRPNVGLEKEPTVQYDMKPGITGMEQISNKTGNERETQAHDIWYAEHRSILLDLKIIFWTIARLISGRPPR